jgi:hypothetical protein
MYSSPSSSARVRSPARSDPALGSLNSWHHTWSPRMIGRRNCCFCSSVPWAMIVGPIIPIDWANMPVGTS